MYHHLLVLMIAMGLWDGEFNEVPPTPTAGGYRLRRFPRAS